MDAQAQGKTVTVRIQPEEAGLLAEWIANGRELNRIVADLERTSDRLTERALREARAEQNARNRGAKQSAKPGRRPKPTK